MESVHLLESTNVSGIKVAAPRAHQKFQILNFKFEMPPSWSCCDVICNEFGDIRECVEFFQNGTDSNCLTKSN
jgi:hypothetical protein